MSLIRSLYSISSYSYWEPIRRMSEVAVIVDPQKGQRAEERHEAQAGREDRDEGRDCETQEDAPLLQGCVRYTKISIGFQYLWFVQAV